MSILNNALIGIFLLVILLGIFSVVFFKYVPMQVDTSNRAVIRYFILYFICIVLGCIVYILRPLFGDQISSLVNGVLYITGSFGLRHGFVLRKTPSKKHMFANPYYWLCILLLLVVNVYYLHEVYNSLWLRITFMNTTFALICFSFLPLVKRHETVTSGETVVKYAISFIMCVFLLLPFIYLATQNVKLYVLSTVITQGLTTHIWLGCLCALMMSDVIKEHYQNSIKDPMTGIYNRRHFMDTAELLSCKQKAQSNALIICDIDDFKFINDTYGHKDGDKAILAFAQMLQNNISKTDMVARIGGEEFAVLLNNLSFAEAKNVANRLCQLTKDIDIKTHNHQQISLTASFGVCKFGKGITLDDAFHGADQAMYHSKANGKSQVQVFEPLVGI